MKHTRYSNRSIRTISPNTCYGNVCDKNRRKGCDKNKECRLDLCLNDEYEIAGRKTPVFEETREQRHKRYDKVKQWRQNSYKKCKKIIIEIKNAKGK